MYIERFLLNMFEEEKEEEKLKGKTKIELLITSDESATRSKYKFGLAFPLWIKYFNFHYLILVLSYCSYGVYRGGEDLWRHDEV